MTPPCASRQPDDAGPITRRAIEVVRLAAAMKADPAVAERWIAYEKRMERWQARDQGEMPRPLHIPIPAKTPLVKQLMDTWVDLMIGMPAATEASK